MYVGVHMCEGVCMFLQMCMHVYAFAKANHMYPFFHCLPRDSVSHWDLGLTDSSRLDGL